MTMQTLTDKRMACEMIADLAHRIALWRWTPKQAGQRDSALLCLRDAETLYTAGQYPDAIRRAARGGLFVY